MTPTPGAWLSLKAPIQLLATVQGRLGMKESLPSGFDAIQWDSLEQEMANSADYDINPDYAEMYEVYSAAKREREG